MLNATRLKAYHRLHEEVNQSVERAVKQYHVYAKMLGLRLENQTWVHGTITEVSWDRVTVYWDEYHRNCKTASGSYTIPMEALAYDTYKTVIVSLVTKQFDQQRDKERADAEYEVNRKRAQLQQLKAELGEL